MKRLVFPVVVLLAAIIVAGGFFMPTIVAQLKDRHTVDVLTITDSGGVSFETKSELKLVDRLKMITAAGRVKLDNGKNMDAGTAYQSALTELSKLSGKGLVDFDEATAQLSSYEVAFLIDSTDPTKSMIVWDVYIQDKSHDINVAVDDETGILLSLNYRIDEMAYKKGLVDPRSGAALQSGAAEAVVPSDGPAPVPSADATDDTARIAQSVADYYGLTLTGTKTQKSSGYYKQFLAELSDGQNSVTLNIYTTYTGVIINA